VSKAIKVGRKEQTGVVASDKMTKSIVVVVERLVKHPVYGKYMRRTTRCMAHDEQSQAHVGDTVRIRQTRPMSRLKCWELIEVVRKA
jgi:small subunit ribosomal protein S17